MTRRELLQLGAATALVPALPPVPIARGWIIVAGRGTGRLLAFGLLSLGDLTSEMMEAWDRGEIIFFDDEGKPI